MQIPPEDSSSEDEYDNFKGRYQQDSDNHNYIDPKTGAHFNYQQICIILQSIQKLRTPRLALAPASVRKNPIKMLNPITKNDDYSNPQVTSKEKVYQTLIRHIKMNNLLHGYKLYNSVKELPCEKSSIMERQRRLIIKSKLNVKHLQKSTNSTLVTDKNIECGDNKCFNFVSLDLRSKAGRNLHMLKESKKMDLLFTPSKSREGRYKLGRVVHILNHYKDNVHLPNKPKQINLMSNIA